MVEAVGAALREAQSIYYEHGIQIPAIKCFFFLLTLSSMYIICDDGWKLHKPVYCLSARQPVDERKVL
jgi:hypothetical protein